MTYEHALVLPSAVTIFLPQNKYLDMNGKNTSTTNQRKRGKNKRKTV